MENLKRKRGTIKGNITRIANYCDSADVSEEGLRARIGRLEEYFKSFEEVQEQIEAISTTAEETEENETNRFEVEEKYYHVKTLNERFRTSSNAETTIIENNEHSSQQVTNAIESLVRNQTALSSIMERMTSSTPLPHTAADSVVQLPKINLPVFDGSYTNWIRFRDLFCALIHNKGNLSNIEKFEYLQSHVSGDALSMIKHLTPSNDNYCVAWQLIKTKFDNATQIKRNYLKMLFDQAPVKGPHVSELKRLFNNTNECVNALKALNEPVEQWDSMLLFNLEKKLDTESQSLWCRQAPENTSFEQFMKFLEKRLIELEMAQTNKQNSNIVHSQQQHWSHNNFGRKNQKTSLTAISNSCSYCGHNDHHIWKCQKFLNLEQMQRFDAVKKLSLCINCFSKEHTVRYCKASQCKICKGSHHTLLHRNYNTSNNDHQQQFKSSHLQSSHLESPSTSQPLQAAGSNQLPKTALISQHRINETQHSDDNLAITHTILATAVVEISDEHGNKYPARALLDSASQANFMTQQLANLLKVKRWKSNTTIGGIGDQEMFAKFSAIVKISSRHTDFAKALNFIILPKITGAQPDREISINSWNLPQNLSLADENFNIPQQIDLLIGADMFFQLFSTK